MRLNVTVDLDWIEEDESIDDEIKRQVLSGVSRQVSEKLLSELGDSAQKQLVEKLENQVSAALTERIETFLTRKFDVTDRFGRKTEEQTSVDDLLAQRVLDATTKPTLNGYGEATDRHPEYSIINWAIHKKMNAVGEFIEKAIHAELKDTKDNIKQMVKEKIKTNVADGLTEMIMKNSSALSLKSGE